MAMKKAMKRALKKPKEKKEEYKGSKVTRPPATLNQTLKLFSGPCEPHSYRPWRKRKRK